MREPRSKEEERRDKEAGGGDFRDGGDVVVVRNGLGGCVGGGTLSFECVNMTRRLCVLFHE